MKYAMIGILWMFLAASASSADALTENGFAETCSDIVTFKIDRSLNIKSMGEYLYSYVTTEGKSVSMSEEVFDDFTSVCSGKPIHKDY